MSRTSLYSYSSNDSHSNYDEEDMTAFHKKTKQGARHRYTTAYNEHNETVIISLLKNAVRISKTYIVSKVKESSKFLWSPWTLVAFLLALLIAFCYIFLLGPAALPQKSFPETEKIIANSRASMSREEIWQLIAPEIEVIVSSLKERLKEAETNKQQYQEDDAKRQTKDMETNLKFQKLEDKIEKLQSMMTNVTIWCSTLFEKQKLEHSTYVETLESFKKGCVTETKQSQVYDTSSLSEDQLSKMINAAIAKYDADKTGLPDYALESTGGSIVSTRCSEEYLEYARTSIFRIPFAEKTYKANIVIQAQSTPGNCWAFRGSQGYLVIKLSYNITPTAFSLEHMPKTISLKGTIDSAPREFTVLGLTSPEDIEGKILGRYQYDEAGEPIQRFDVQESNPGYFQYIELRIDSNHGNKEYTCLYRFRVHGKPIKT